MINFIQLRQYRAKIVRQMRSQIFVRLHKNSAGILPYVKGFLCDMTENLQADGVQSRQAGFVRCCLNKSGLKNAVKSV
ncbi:hypothetical protein [Ruminococcus sp.]|uniref:hypothetical protein n=1 Tax=Ruminococcus sp. TaxID=41978 RepID=UPI00352175B7